MRRHKYAPPITLPVCCFLHSGNKQWADLRTNKETKLGCSTLEVLMLDVNLPWVHDGTGVTALSLTVSSHKITAGAGAVFSMLPRALQHKTFLVSWKGKFPAGQLLGQCLPTLSQEHAAQQLLCLRPALEGIQKWRGLVQCCLVILPTNPFLYSRLSKPLQPMCGQSE